MDTRPQAQFRPDRRYTVAAAVGAALAAAAVALAPDRPGQVLGAVALALLAGSALGDLCFSPRLIVTAQGLTVNAPLTWAHLPWAEIEEVRVDSRLRRGLRTTTMEIDAGAVFVVLSRRALGADPADAAALVRAFRPPAPERQ